MFKVTITEIRKKVVFVHDVDYDFEAERKVEQDYLLGKIDMQDVDPATWTLNVEELD